MIAAERARVATEGWGARLLALQGDDGQWAGGAYFPDDATAATEPGQPWTSTAHVLELLRRFGLSPGAAQEPMAGVAENCRWEHDGQRFSDGEVETGSTADDAVLEPRLRGQDYLLQRRLLRTASTGELIDPDFTTLAFPPRWYFDVLRALDHLRDAGTFLEHCREAVEAVAAQQDDDGSWLLGHAHPGRVPFELEPVGAPSR